MKSNFLSIPTDCPQRDERLGWTGDINVFADTANYLFDTSGMITSWLKDVSAEQGQANGIVPLTLPNVVPGLADESHAIWGDVAVMLPWAMYTAFGDKAILARQYGSMEAWLRCIPRREDGLWDYTSDWKLGDWLDPVAPPEDPGNASTDPLL
ncbi:Alpha-L-rhamnosidase, partial [Fulvia fulva]